MHQIRSAEDGKPNDTGPLSAPQHPNVGREPQWVRIGRGTYPFGSYAEVSAAYRATIERLDLGASETPSCELLDAAGSVMARVAYSGRIFEAGADGEADHSILLYEARGG